MPKKIFKNDKIFLAGSKGMVGSSIKRNLIRNGYGETSKGGDLITPDRSDLDLTNYSDVKAWFNINNPDVVIIAAAEVGGIMANNTDRFDFIMENLKINMNILESLKAFPDTKVINLGSSCIYPLNVENPIKESSIMDGRLESTNSPYAMAKLTAIEIGDAMSKQF